MRGMLASLLVILGLIFAGCPEPEPEPKPDPPPPPKPSLIALSPAIGLTVGGETVTLNGANLTDTKVVAFGTAAATIELIEAEKVVVKAPAGTRGVVSIKLTATGGEAELENAFTYQQGVSISSVTPNTMPANIATSITVEGQGFQLDSVDPVVQLGPTSLSVTGSTPTSVTANIPASAIATLGFYDVTVTNADSRAALMEDAVEVLEPVIVAAVSPNWTYATETKDVVITGSGFDGATSVYFGTAQGTGLNVISGTTLEVRAPVASSGGAVDVIVQRSVGDTGTLTGGFNYYDATDPTLRVLQILPGIGSETGGTQVQIYGTGFDAVTTFTFGGAQAAVDQTFGSTHVQVTTPVHNLAGTEVSEPVDVEATKGVNTAQLNNGFIYYRVPTVSQVNPETLATAGGDMVTINGTGFTIGSTRVFFGTCECTNVQVTNQAQLTCTSPVCDSGDDVPVRVESEYDTSGEWVGVNFVEYTRIISVTPSTISKAGRTFLTVEATGLADPTEMLVTLQGNQGSNSVDDLLRPEPGILTFHTRGPMNVGEYTLTITNLNNNQEDSTTLYVVDTTDKDIIQGGGSITGNINVTVMRDDTDARLENAVVFAGNDSSVTEASYNKGLTDADGMTVISGDQVANGPITITVGKIGFETQTIMGLNAQNITVMLSPHEPTAVDPGSGKIQGTVVGWANAGLPGGSPANRYYRVAQVFPSDRNANTGNYATDIASYAIEIRSNEQQSACELFLFDGTVYTLSNASFSVDSLPGTHAALAVVSYWDSIDGICHNQPFAGTEACAQQNNQNCETWLWGVIGSTYGITTGIDVQRGGTIGNITVNLDVPAVTYSMSINNSPSYDGAPDTAYTTDAYLNLGNSGTFTFLGQLLDSGAQLGFGAVPMLRSTWTYTVRGYVAAPIYDGVNLVNFQAPVSTSYSRDLTSMGPPTLNTWVYFPENMAYADVANTEGRFSYDRFNGATPDMTAIVVYDVDPGYVPIWSVLHKGDPQTVTLPDLSAENRIETIPGGEHLWTLYHIKVDNFDFDNHSATERTNLAWRAGVQSETQVLTR